MTPLPLRPAPRERIALALTLLGGLALRLFRLGAESLWYDETVSVYLAGSPVPELIRHTAGDIHPPGYYLLLRGWLLLTGYGDGRADPQTFGLEFSAAFLSLFFGVLLIALVYALARRLAGPTVALIAAALVALSPFNVWYSQEARMYTVGATLGVLAFCALLTLLHSNRPERPAILYALAAALGMYVLYYFAFLLVALNVWALLARLRQRRTARPILLANLLAAILYAPWIPVAFRQATQPPVPPWRAAPNVFSALAESWAALSFGQSAPGYLWPALLLTAALCALGLLWLTRRGHGTVAAGLAAATVGPLLLILLVSLATPLYHVRYIFTYSPAFYVMLAAGIVALARAGLPRVPAMSARLRRGLALGAALLWLIAAVVTLRAYWLDPAYRPDDHRTAARELAARWRPGDAVIVNAGWAYTALATYWTGDLGSRARITGPLPSPRADAALVMLTTGHTDGDAGLGWGDPRSDFFAMPAEVAKQQTAALFSTFDRVWHYRIYDTVNDPDGLMRALLPRHGELVDDRGYAGEAFLRVERYAPRAGVAWDDAQPGAAYPSGLDLRFEPVDASLPSGESVYAALTWRPAAPLTATVATSVRLLGPDGEIVYQPPDEQPLGPLFPSPRWPVSIAQRQTVAIAAPEGTPPGIYPVALVVYDAATGQPFEPATLNGGETVNAALRLGALTVTRPAAPLALRRARAIFGPLALIEARTPVTVIGPGGMIPVELLWQLRQPADELVVVVQLLDHAGQVAANLEERPTQGRYPPLGWAVGELVRDHHALTLPADITPGAYRLVVGLYRAADGKRLTTRAGLFGQQDHFVISSIEVR